jgi:hypothetical protein
MTARCRWVARATRAEDEGAGLEADPSPPSRRAPDPIQRAPPSERIGESVSRLLRGGIQGDGSVVQELLCLGAQRFAQERVEREADAFLGRDHDERRAQGEELRGYRNG